MALGGFLAPGVASDVSPVDVMSTPELVVGVVGAVGLVLGGVAMAAGGVQSEDFFGVTERVESVVTATRRAVGFSSFADGDLVDSVVTWIRRCWLNIG